MANGCQVFQIIVARLRDYGQLAFWCYFSWHHCRHDDLAMISFSIVFFLPLTFLSLHSLSAISNSFYLLLFFHSCPTLSKSLLMQFPGAISVILASSSLQLSEHLLSLPVFHLPFFPHAQPMYSSNFFLALPFTPTSTIT